MNNDGEIRIGTKIDNSGFEKGAKDLKKEAEQVDKEVTQIMSKSASSTNKFGNAIGGVAKKVIGLGSALFDVVAVGAGLGALAIGGFILGKALDKANGKTDQLKANLSYIGFVASKIFENLLQPAIDKTTGAVNGLVGALYKVVVYIGYILGKWFGVENIFEGTSFSDYAKSMESASKSAKSTAKSTKQIKKDLMGFDEVNKLSDNTTGGTGGVGGGGVTLPTLPNLGDVKIPDWVKWIADHKDLILDVVGALLALLTFSKVVSWLAPLKDFFGMFAKGNIASNLGLTGTQLGLIVGSLAVIAFSIHKIKKDMDETYKKIKDIYDVGDKELDDWLKGEHSVEEVNDRIAVKKKGLFKTQKDIASVGHSIVGDNKEDYNILRRNLEQQDKLLQYKVQQWRQGKLTKEQEQELILELQTQRDEVEKIAKQYEPVVGNTQELYDKSVEYKDILGEIGVVVNDNNRYIDYSVDSIDRFGFNASKAKTSVGQIGDAIIGVADKVTGADKKTDTWYSKLTSIKDKIVQIANQPLPKKDLKVEINADTSKAKKALQDMLQSWAKGPTGNLLKKLGFDDIVGKIANIKLARGGIINNPGRGVSLGTNIIGGEAGSEAVLPLDDTTMDRLGNAIARHMNINLTNVTQMNGRTIGRELKQIMNENEFTYNG